MYKKMLVEPTPLWMDFAACKGSDPDKFIPLSEKSREGKRQIQAAKIVCAECIVKDICLEYAIAHNSEGVWGGKTESERNTIRKNRNTRLDNERKIS